VAERGVVVYCDKALTDAVSTEELASKSADDRAKIGGSNLNKATALALCLFARRHDKV
jgi:hypothetical protein